VFINGQIASYNAELVATFQYATGSLQIGTSDFRPKLTGGLSRRMLMQCDVS
jgi:hypothetical protein